MVDILSDPCDVVLCRGNNHYPGIAISHVINIVVQRYLNSISKCNEGMLVE